MRTIVLYNRRRLYLYNYYSYHYTTVYHYKYYYYYYNYYYYYFYYYTCNIYTMSSVKNVSWTTLLNKTRYLRRGRSRIFRFGPRGRYRFYILCVCVFVLYSCWRPDIVAMRNKRTTKKKKSNK